MDVHTDDKVVDSWQKNVAQWTAAVRDGEIESRTAATNQAIIEAVLRYSPSSMLDVGCGEGWLIRELSPHVTRLVGVDAVSGLIQQAEAAGGGTFFVASYDDIVHGAIKGSFGALVCNFSLLGKESVEGLFSVAPSLVEPGGVLIVQTLHPVFASGELPYADGWRDGSWAGFNSSFIDPAPWYFRTLASWVALFTANGFRLLEVCEPVNPNTHKPASIVFIGAHAANKSFKPTVKPLRGSPAA